MLVGFNFKSAFFAGDLNEHCQWSNILLQQQKTIIRVQALLIRSDQRSSTLINLI